MGGIKDYTYQNIIFVHDFVFIFLILVFWVIIAYFIVVLYEYTVDHHSAYFRLFTKDFVTTQKNTTGSSLMVKYAIHMKSVLNQVHNLKLEVIWTFIPIFIILELIFPSLSLIADDEISNKASLNTVNVIGNQWYWTYELNAVMGSIKQVSNLIALE